MTDFRSYSAAFHAQNDDILHFGIKGMKWHKRKKKGSIIDAVLEREEEKKKKARLATVESASKLGETTMVKPDTDKKEEKKPSSSFNFKEAKNVTDKFIRKDPTTLLLKAGANIVSNLNKKSEINTAKVNAAFKAAPRKKPSDFDSDKKDDKKRRRGRYADRKK